MSGCPSIFATRPRLFSSGSRWTGCTPPSAAERMARYSAAHAQRVQDRENAGAAPPKVRLVDGRPVLLALPGSVNPLPKARKPEPQEEC